MALLRAAWRARVSSALGQCLSGAGFFELRLSLPPGRFGRFHARFGLGNRAGIEQLRIAGLDHREQRFAGHDRDRPGRG